MSTATRAALSETSAKSSELELGDLAGLMGFHLRLAQVAMYRDFSVALKPLDLTQKQCAVLSLLSSNPGCSQIALGAALGADRATMMAIVDRLQDRHLLFRIRSKTDRRRQELYLTNEGRAALDEALRLIRDHEARFTQRFTAAELQQLLGFLARIYGDSPAPPP